MTAPLDRLRGYARDALAALSASDEGRAKWAAVFAGVEIGRLEQELGRAVEWPPGLSADPLKGWVEYGIRLSRPQDRAVVEAGWRPRPGANRAAHAVGRDE